MQRTVIELVDDLDGTKAEQTVTFAIDGVEYEIDLSAENAGNLRKSLDDYVSKARKIRGRARGGQRQAPAAVTQVDNKAVRAWAKSNNIDLSSRGRIPADVIEQYRQAGH